MGSEFVRRKSSVCAKKSDTKPSLFTSRSLSSPTNKEDTVNKKELSKEVPQPDYIFSNIGVNAPQPTVQREVESPEEKEPEQEVNLSRSSNSPIVDEGEKEETLSPSLEDEGKEEDLGKQSVQTKLTVGEPGDKYEQEADTVAAKVVEQINSPKTEQPVQGKVEPVVQPTLMRQGGAAGGTVNRDVEQNIQQVRGSGQGLSDNVREPMEQAFGADFSGVKVHTDGQADTLNRSLNSRAFATGQDIFFKQGEYNPGSKQGQELLAHELTHVVQQTGAGSQIQRVCGVNESCPEEMMDNFDKSSSAGITSADAPMSVSVFDKLNVASGESGTSPEILEAKRELATLEKELAWELSKAAVDIAGIVDPTPTSDLVGASMSLAEGDLVGAGLSLISTVPYVGDALGKTAKGARAAKKIANLQKKIVALSEKIKPLNKATDKARDAAKVRDTAKATDKAGGIKKPEKAGKQGGDDFSNPSASVFEGAKKFEENISKLPPAERVAKVSETAKKIAKKQGWTKNKKLSRTNGRDVYYDANSKKYYSIDTQHGRFEVANKRGKHLEEVDFDLNRTKSRDTSGSHDLKTN